MADQAKLNLLWKRVEDARLQWKFARNYVNEVNEDRVGVPSADGSYAHLHALHAQHLAVESYLNALQEFKAALALENAPQEQLVETQEANTGHAAITPREREVLKLIAVGKSSKQVAVELGIAFRTVVCHRYRLYQKLKVHTSVELTRAALKMGLIEL